MVDRSSANTLSVRWMRGLEAQDAQNGHNMQNGNKMTLFTIASCSSRDTYSSNMSMHMCIKDDDKTPGA
jgi:hypothetical protein